MQNNEEAFYMFKIDHVSLSVIDAVKTIAFYEALDFNVTNSYKADDGSLEIHTLTDKDGVILELFCFTSYQPAPEHTHNLNTDLPVIGVKHFGLRVASIDSAVDALIEKGFASNVKTNTGRLGRNYFFIKDPNGILLEIIAES